MRMGRVRFETDAAALCVVESIDVVLLVLGDR